MKQDDFKKWLKLNKPKSERHYSSGFNTIDKICSSESLESLTNWTLDNWSENYNKLSQIKKYNDLNESGKNILFSTLSNFKHFLESLLDMEVPPKKPFDEFKWRWASTTPSEGLNRKDVLFGVLKILVKHNGKKHATQEFRDDLIKLEDSLDTDISLSKKTRAIEKNIIENSGQYWKALGLINTTSGGVIDVTNLGLSVVNEHLTDRNFIKYQIENFSLPNRSVENSSTILQYENHQIKVKPLLLIIKVLSAIERLTKPLFDNYITIDEISKIVVPLSIDSRINTTTYAENILNYRKDPESYGSWPSYTPQDNDSRMLGEYLIFLANFGVLTQYKTSKYRYHVNEMTLSLMREYDNDSEISLKSTQANFLWGDLYNDILFSGLILSENLIQRFIASLQTKQFVILTGLTGSGKTKLAEFFASWICENENQICMIAVGADWTNREPLLGYPNALNIGEYVRPESGVLDLILNAQNDSKNPYFLILDEMNMSHVERYFADFLSAMESVNSTISLHSGDKGWSGVPSKITLPENLFIIGTVNIDETTYMFSPKVLDRANVIEFRVSEDEMKKYLNSLIKLEMKDLNGKGAHMAQDFLSIALNKTEKVEDLSDVLMPFFNNLQAVGAEFGYRSASEINRFVGIYNSMNGITDEHDAIDAAIAQKLLPKLHGSRNKLQKILTILAKQCLYDASSEDAFRGVSEGNIKYPISYEKLERMHKRIMADGFTSFAEA